MQVHVLSTGTEFDILISTKWNKIIPYDEKSDYCWGSNYINLKEEEVNACLPDNGKNVPGANVIKHFTAVIYTFSL